MYAMALISAEDVANEIGLAADELSKPCENNQLSFLAIFFREWRVIFSSLLSEIDLGDVDRENHTEQEKRIAALRKWKARKGDRATYEVLVDALLNNGEKDQAESLCKFLSDHRDTTTTDYDAKESEFIIDFECPCSGCSLETYLQNGCPKSCIPYLGMTSLSKDDQENLNYMLKKDTKKIMKSFTYLSNRTCDSLVQQGVTVERLIRVAANCNAYLLERLVKLTSIDLVFAALTTEMSFFNHGILVNIIEELGDKDDKKRLTGYFKEFTEFCKRKVFEIEPGDCTCGQRFSRMKGKKLFVVLLPTGDKAMVETLEDAVNVKEMLADILGVLPAALHLHRIDRGSVILVFSVPDCIAEDVFPLSKEKIVLLRVKGIILFIPQELGAESNQVEGMEAFAGGTDHDIGEPLSKPQRGESESVTLSPGEEVLTKDIDYNCFACKQPLCNPYLVLCCQRNFCFECMDTIQAEGKPCPSCQQPDFEYVPDVKCRRFCQKMFYTCPYCKSFTSSIQDVQSSHWPECPFFPISCPNMCRTRPQRQHIEAHIEKECPFTLVDCDLKSETECQIRTSRVDMFAHLITHIAPQSVQDALHRAWTWYTTYKEHSHHKTLAISMPKGPGYECEFAEPVPDAFQTKCPICMEILREPYSTSCCGKNFCLFCITPIRDNEPCPYCKCQNYTISFNKGLQQTLIQLQVFCSNKEGGCQWKGELSQLENHLNLDPKPEDQMTGCLLAKIGCKYCSKQFKRNEIDKHQSGECSSAPTSSGTVVGGGEMALVVLTGIVGSINVGLERSYRVMLLKIANELTLDDCQKIAFVAGLAAPTCHPESGKPSICLHLMSTLESLGHIGPLKLDFLEELIEAIGKKYLLEIIQGYKKNPLYKEAIRRLDEQDKKKKKGKKSKQQTPAAEYSPEQLVASMINPTEMMHKLQESYATLLTQLSQVALLMRSALESDDPARIEQTFLSVASDGDAIARTLRKNLEKAGLKCGDKESSGSDSQDNSPTNEERHLEASLSPPSPVQVESLYPQCHKWSMPESSPSPTLPKMPIPLPRKKRLQQTLTQISSPGSSLSTSSTTHHFVFCQETQAPSSLPDTFHIPQPQSVSTSCLTASANYSGDYSGDTGDSGVGDIRHKYIPSQEALDQLDPNQCQLQSRQDRSIDEWSRYMKLKTKEEKCPDVYTKPLRARNLYVTSQQVEDNDEDLTTSTFTGGDSGFTESSDFLKVSLSGQQESHDHDQASAQAPYSSGQPEAEESSDGGYAPLNMEAVHTGYYKSLHRQGIQEVQYAPQAAPQTHPSVQYMNFSPNRK